jgi:hypothetical protein
VSHHPDFDELIGSDVPQDERARLRRAHDALIAAGPPAELPRSSVVPPGSPAPIDVPILPRRRLAATIVLAATLALAAFGVGFLLGGDDGNRAAFETDFVLAMRGTEAAPTAHASLLVGKKDDDGNWPMRMTVQGLEKLPEDAHYELLLTKNGKLAISCGTFRIEDDETVVYLNAPYRLKQYTGWAITREDSDEILVRTQPL